MFFYVCAAVLDVQVLGDTLDKIAWEKGGIFKEGCRAMTVEQPRGGMSVLREASDIAVSSKALPAGFFFLRVLLREDIRPASSVSAHRINVYPCVY